MCFDNIRFIHCFLWVAFFTLNHPAEQRSKFLPTDKFFGVEIVPSFSFFFRDRLYACLADCDFAFTGWDIHPLYILPISVFFAVTQFDSNGSVGDNVIIITTRRGRESALHNGYQYYIKQTCRDRTVSWNCANRRTMICPATVLTKDGKMLKLLTRHTCQPNYIKNKRLEILHRCITAMDPFTVTASGYNKCVWEGRIGYQWSTIRLVSSRMKVRLSKFLETAFLILNCIGRRYTDI